MCDHAPNREDAMVVIQRDAVGVPTVWCDPCIAPLVRALNKSGIRTVASCCGHGRLRPSILLADGTCLVVGTGEDLDELTGATDGVDINSPLPTSGEPR